MKREYTNKYSGRVGAMAKNVGIVLVNELGDIKHLFDGDLNTKVYARIFASSLEI